jgi:hypothetical protein
MCFMRYIRYMHVSEQVLNEWVHEVGENRRGAGKQWKDGRKDENFLSHKKLFFSSFFRIFLFVPWPSDLWFLHITNNFIYIYYTVFRCPCSCTYTSVILVIFSI